MTPSFLFVYLLACLLALFGCLFVCLVFFLLLVCLFLSFFALFICFSFVLYWLAVQVQRT